MGSRGDEGEKSSTEGLGLDDGRGVGRAAPDLILPEGNVVKFFDHWVERAPDRVAIAFPSAPGGPGRARPEEVRHELVTFAGLDRDASRVAWGLRERGVARGDRVLLMVPMSRPLYAALLGVMKLGACAVFVDPWVPLPQIARAVELTRPRAFVGVPKAHLLRAGYAAVRDVPVKLVACSARPWLDRALGVHLEDLLARPGPGGRDDFPLVPCEQGEPSLITFTTGSTGTPKGANRTHRFLNAQGDVLKRHLLRAPGDVDMPALPVFVLNNLAAGVPSVLPLVDFRRIASVDPAVVVQQIEDLRVTTIGGSPSYLAPIARHVLARGRPLARVRAVVAGGAPVPPGLLDLLRRACPNARGRIEVLYGSTEAEPVATIEADEVLGETAARTARGEGTCVGRPSDEVEVRLVVPTDGPWTLGPRGWRDVEVPVGVPGEVLVTGAHVQRDYVGDRSAFARNKVVEPDTGRVWHRMGDVAARDERGRLWLAGRVGEDVRDLRGRTVWPLHVEGLVDALEGVARAALVAVDGLPVLALVPAPEVAHDPAAEAALRTRVRRALRAADLALEDVRLVDAVPLDPRHNAKLDRPRLVEALRGGHG